MGVELVFECGEAGFGGDGGVVFVVYAGDAGGRREVGEVGLLDKGPVTDWT